ncbi:MAG: C10 family peptidase [Candidatus Eisenbacteria sp.]|nr:C10 family peptidase [Candidatus Eisenbacteria bacterium]
MHPRSGTRTLGLWLTCACCLAAALGSPRPAAAERATIVEAEQACRNWLTYVVDRAGAWGGAAHPAIQAMEEIRVDGILLAYAFRIEPQGQIVVPVLKELPPIKIYSEQCAFDPQAAGGVGQLVRDMLDQRAKLFIEHYGDLDAVQAEKRTAVFDPRHRTEWNSLAIAPEEFTRLLREGRLGPLEQAGPLMTTAWNQGSPYNNFCPMGDGGRCVVGCVATATVQVMRYYRWPPAGTGSHSYNWGGDTSCGGSTPGELLVADFSDPYDWAAMPNHCSGGYSGEQADALAELCYEVGVAYEMYYGRCGSGAHTGSCMQILPDHFGYVQGINKQNRANHTAASWFSIIQQEVDYGRPMLYDYVYSAVSGHAIVCDGWRDTGEQQQIHINYGWGGTYDGWFAVDGIYHDVDPRSDHLYRRIRPSYHYACCVGSACQIMEEETDCLAAGGIWMEGVVSCSNNPCQPQTHLITADGMGDFPTIQAAIDDAADWDIIELADGTFTGAGNRGLDFHGKPITLRSQSDNPGSVVIDCQDLDRGCTFHSGENGGTLLQALTITAGYATGAGNAGCGGGICCDSASAPRLVEVVLLGNRAISGGGGLACLAGSDPELSGCRFVDNLGEGLGVDGGGLLCRASQPTLSECTFWGNAAPDSGGAVYCAEGGYPLLEACTLADNEAPLGASLACRSGARPILERCILAYSPLGSAVACVSGSVPTIFCTDIYGHDGGDWVGLISTQQTGYDNLWSDPLFCDQPAGDFALQTDSPCLPWSHPECERMGAWPAGCGTEAFACCVGDACQIMTYADCLAAGGAWQYGLTACTPDPCAWRACCVEGACQVATELACTTAEGVWHSGIDACDPDPCVEAACCFGETCQVLSEYDCADGGGTWRAEAADCSPNPCMPYGACCMVTGCEVLTLEMCQLEGGVWYPDVAGCDPSICTLPDSSRLFGGVLIVHAPPGLQYTIHEDWCQRYEDGLRIGSSAEQITRIDPELGEETAVFFLLAAWDQPKEWRWVSFGLGSYDPALFVFGEWGGCNGNGLVQETPDWPGPGEGTVVMHADRWSGDIEPIYWFAGYAYGPEEVPFTAAELDGMRGFGNCSSWRFDIDCLGTLGVHTDGVACYPAPLAACCVDTVCTILTEDRCLLSGGTWRADLETCDPNPCLSYACCIGQDCLVLNALDCASAGGTWQEGVLGCDPSPCLPPQTYLVAPDGSGDFPTIQAAVTAARTIDTIELADGVFSGDGNRDVDYLGKDLTIRSQNGDPALCVIDCQGAGGDHHRGFLFVNGETPAARLEGVSVTQGYTSNGGGIYCSGSSPTIAHCVFKENTAGIWGGGLLCDQYAAPIISECAFIGNLAAEGGGLACHDHATLWIDHSTIVENHAGAGGGLHAEWYATANLDNTIIAFSPGGAAVTCGVGSSVTLGCCDLFGNVGGDWTGCIAAQAGIDGNLEADPAFCAPAAGDFTLMNTSPCAAEHAPPGCGRIGANDVGCDDPAGIETRPAIPAQWTLAAASPAAAGGPVAIHFGVPAGRARDVHLSLFDITGRQVALIYAGSRSPGCYTIQWDGRNRAGMPLRSGVYFARLHSKERSLTRRILLIR